MKIQVTPHTIQIIRDTDINAGEYNVSKCTFEFSNEYQELSNVAVFTNCEGTCVEQAITNNECIIPYEMLENPGQVKLGVYGYEVEEETLVLRYSPTAQYFNVKNGSYAEGEQPTPPSPSIVEQLQAQITDNRNDINDLQEDVGNIKEDITELQGDVSNLEQTKADKSELSQVAFSGSYNDLSNKPFIPTKVSQLDNDSGYIDKNVDDLTNYTPTNELSAVATSGSYNDLEDKPDLSVYATTQSLNDEISNRQIADNNLQGQIDAITSSSDVKDIVGTYQELLEYDTSTLGNDDIIKVLEDNTHNDAMTYYRWVISGSSGSWEYIGQEGPYYTKSQTNDLLSEKVGFTDYATGSKGGVIKRSTTYATNMSNDGVLYASTKTYADYPNLNGNAFISKGTLENVITGKKLTNKTYVDNADNLKEDKSNKVTSIDENSTDTEYPSAKCVYDSQLKQDREIEKAKMVYNALPKVTGEGESVTLDNTAECPMEVSLKPSELYQETTTGKNILDITTSQTTVGGIPISVEDGVIKLNGTSSSTTANWYCRVFQTNSGNAIFSLEVTGYTDKDGNNASLLVQQNTENASTGWTTLGEINLKSNQPKEVSITLDNTKYYRVRLFTNENTFTNATIKAQLEYGTTKTDWEPYTNGASPNPQYPQEIHTISGDNEIKVENRNLFDKNSITSGYYLSETGTNVQDNTSFYSDYIYVYNKQVIVNVMGNWLRYTCYYDKNKNFISSESGQTIRNNNNIFTIPNNAYFMKVSNTLVNLDTLQIEYGTTVSNYVPHQEQSLPLNLGDLEYCKIGDYEDEFFKAVEGNDIYDSLDSTTKASLTSGMWYLQKNVGKVVLNGSESWGVYADTLYNSSILNNIGAGVLYTNRVLNGYCNRTDTNVKTNLRYYDNNCLGLQFYNVTSYWGLSEASESAFNSYLINNNIIIYYPLATPTYILLNNTLQEQLENIYNHVNSYNEQTNVSQENNDLPFVLKLSAIRDLSNIFELIESQ